MNHKTAAELADHSGWHYVTRNRRTGTHPIGYCRDHVDQPHATEREARECYAKYVRENSIRLDAGVTPDQQRKCEVCGAWTQLCAQVGHVDVVYLCEQHRTSEGVLQARPHLMEPAGDSWGSW